MTLAEALDRHDSVTVTKELRAALYDRLTKRLGISRDEAKELRRELLAEACPEPLDDPAFVCEPGYVHNEVTGTYVFRVPGLADGVELSESRVDQILADYSNLVGKASTVNEIVRAQGLPRPVIRSILRDLGKTHDSLPWTDEKLERSTDDELAAEAGSMRRLDLHSRIEREKWRDEQRDAKAWRNARETLVQPMLEWAESRSRSYAPAPVVLTRQREPYGVVIGLTDEHWGVQADGWSMALHRECYLDLLSDGLAETKHLGRPDFALVVIGSDGLHVDAHGRTTTRGTQVHLEASIRRVVQGWLDYKVEQIDLVRSFAKRIEAWHLEGNHDRFASYLMAEQVRAWYRRDKDVSVTCFEHNTPAMAYGESLLAWHHGDALKPKHLAEVLPERWPAEWGATRHRYLYRGHFHHEQDLPTRSGLQVLTMPSAVPPDDWHTSQGYSSRPHLLVDSISPTRGRFLRADAMRR